MLDTVIASGEIIDGTGRPRFRADVGIEQGRIAAVGDLHDAERRLTIPAEGRVVAPGFIDIHCHSDFTLLADGRGLSKAFQGVTTEVNGNCGGFAAPLYGAARAYAEHRRDRVGTAFSLDWTTMAEYLDKLEHQGVSYNIVTLVGHANVRASVIGLEERRPSAAELARMQEVLAEALAHGAYGMSTGLFYAPGSFADTDEVVALARTLAEHGALYASHIRDEGNNTVGVIAALNEAVRIARESGVRMQVSHLEAIGITNWGSATAMLDIIDSARGEGLDVTFDVNPYTTTGTNIDGALTPRWALDGGRQVLIERLRDPHTRPRLREDYAITLYKARGGPDRILVTEFGPDPSLEGKTLSEIASVQGRDPVDLLLDLSEQDNATLVSYSVSDADAELIMRHPTAMISSDGLSVAADGPLSGGKQHPCDFGTYPRALGHYSRDKGLWPLETAVQKCTGLPAARLGWTERGTLQEGSWADVVVFDPLKLQDNSTLLEPHRYPDGIDYVVVNGEAIVEHGRHSGRRPGFVLRRQGGRA
jgi:N-acyl-D-amino-acid deacylase